MKKRMRRITAAESRRNLLWIILGTLLMAAATNLFFTPADMVPGGFTGLAIIVKHLTASFLSGGIPVWLGNILLNIPLIIAAIRIRGWRFMRRTLLASVVFSAWLYVIPEYRLIGSDLFLTSVWGGLILGVGLGLVFIGKATTGGTDTIAALFQSMMPHVSVARILPFLDVAVILLSVWIFGIEVSLYAAITVVLSGIAADRIMSGMRNAYLAYIISEKHKKIAERIMRDLDRGATMLPGTGMYTKKDRPVLFCAVSRKQSADLKELVYSVDPDAFVVLHESREIRGEGFLRYSREEL